MKNQLIHDCKKELRSLALKATPARVAVMQLFENSSEPLTVQTIIDFLRNRQIEIDPATAFRMVNTFTQKGITKQIQFYEGKYRYELSSKEDHHHLICQICGTIEDISDCGIKEIERQIKRKKKFQVKHHALEFYGVCQLCQH